MTKLMPVLGHTADGEAVSFDMEELIGSDVCVIANKGAGKSGMLRVLFEQTRPLIQQVILDCEDEFYTLREVGEYLVAGGETGDCPAEIANAGALARMLMENPGISAVIQLGHLKPWDQEAFVALFLEELMSTPRALWHPFMLGIDETHRFAPQGEQVASSKVMHDVSARGRKRGITPVFATQRMAAIDKNVTAGVSTWFLGRVGQDIDRRTAANALGMAPGSAEAKEIPFLPKRTFWTFGSATSLRPVLFKVADAQTTMVKAGQALVATPPPPKSLGKLLEALSKAAAPVVTPEASDAVPGAPSVDLEAVRKDAYQDGHADGYNNGYQIGSSLMLEAMVEWAASMRPANCPDINVGTDDRDNLDGFARTEPDGSLTPIVPTPADFMSPKVVHMAYDKPVKGDFVQKAVQKATTAVAANMAAGTTNSAGLSLLDSLTRHYPMRLTWAQLAGFSQRKPRGGSFNSARRWLLDEGLVIENGDSVEATAKGLAMKPAPAQSEDKIESWAAILPAPADQLLRYLVDHSGITPIELAEATGRQPRGGSWNTAMRHLKSNDLVQEVDGHLSVSPWLFD